MKKIFTALNDRLDRYGLNLFVAFVFLLTLYMHDGFFDLMRSKALFFSYGIYLFVPLCLILIFKRLFSREKKQVRPFDLSVLLFLLSSFFSTVLSYNRHYAFSGEQGWYIGYFTIFSLGLLYFGFKDVNYKESCFFILLLGFLIETVLILLNSAGFDVLGIKAQMRSSQYYNFYATLGNNNWIVGYLSLMVPYVWCRYMKEDHRRNRIVYLVLSVLGILASVLNGADGIYISLALSFMIVLPLLLNDLLHIRKLLLLAVFSCFGFYLIGILPMFEKRLENLRGFGNIFFDRSFLFWVFLGSLIALFYASNIKERKYRSFRKKMILTVEVLTVLLIVGVVFYVSHEETDFSNGRMMLWSHSLKFYAERFPLKMKIFGIGPELLNNVYAPLSQDMEASFICSHSEPIQTLLTMGIAGLIFWAGMWTLLFVNACRKKTLKHFTKIEWFAGICGYFAQCLVNSATTLNLCMLLLFVILFMHES